METLQQRFDRIRQQPSDISSHTHILYDLACQSNHVTEMGVRGAVSTTFLYHALARSRPRYGRSLVCYDINDSIEGRLFEAFAKQPEMPSFEFYQMDSKLANIEMTDLLFIDTLHCYNQLKAELSQHASKVRKWIALHDTTTFGEHGEGGGVGLWPAVEEFLEQGTFQLQIKDEKQHGFTVLKRKAKGLPRQVS